MFRTNPANPCELQYRTTSNELWQTIFSSENCCHCSDDLPASYARECNLASYLTEVILPDGIEKTLLAFDTFGNGFGFGNALSGILVVAFPGAAIGLLAAGGVAAIASLGFSIVTNIIRGQLTNQYWLKLKQELFQAMPEDGRLTQDALRRLAWAVQNVFVTTPGDSENANQLVREVIRGLNPQLASRISVVGPDYNGGGCQGAPVPACELVPRLEGSTVTQLGPGQYRISSSFVYSDYRLRYLNTCCQLRIDQVWKNGQVVPLNSVTSLFPTLYPTDTDTTVEYLDSLAELPDRDFVKFSIYNSQAGDDSMIDVTLINCGQSSPSRLFYKQSNNRLTPLSPDADGNYRLFDWMSMPDRDTNGFRRETQMASGASICAR